MGVMNMDNMSAGTQSTSRVLLSVAQLLAKWALVALTLAAITSCVLAAFGVLPWLNLFTQDATGASIAVGKTVQIIGSVFLVALLAYLPGVSRLLELEKTHRDFSLSVTDVARAYQISHSADRKNKFALSGEFDSVRARLEHLRDHPDLTMLEPDILELAAQMSHASRDIAQIYSEKKVRRAKAFLEERQHEIEEFQEKLNLALAVTAELNRWRDDIDASEREIDRQVDRLEKDLKEVLPSLGYELDEDLLEFDDKNDRDGKVVQISGKSALTTPDAPV